MGVSILGTAVLGVAVVSILVLGAAALEATVLPTKRSFNTAAGTACLAKRESDSMTKSHIH